MTKLAICGCGAIGSQLAMHLAYPDHTYLLIDDDKVEVTNLLTTIYSRHHVGVHKATVLSELLWHKCRCMAKPIMRTMMSTRRLLEWEPELIVDCFDNTDARQLLCGLSIPTIHVGVSETRVGAIVWDGRYRCPSGPPRGEDHICTHELGRPILRLTATLTANVIERYLLDGHMVDMYVTEDGRTYT